MTIRNLFKRKKEYWFMSGFYRDKTGNPQVISFTAEREAGEGIVELYCGMINHLKNKTGQNVGAINFYRCGK